MSKSFILGVEPRERERGIFTMENVYFLLQRCTAAREVLIAARGLWSFVFSLRLMDDSKGTLLAVEPST